MQTDSEIKRNVEEELRFDPSIRGADIAVAVKDGVVTLTGFVHSYSQKYDAERAVKRLGGVRGVANDIEVRLPDIDAKTDPEIARACVEAIKHDLPLSWERIKVIVRSGFVTLEGEVEWNYQRERAGAAVRGVKGVKGVVNTITIKPSVPPSEIKQKIEQAFRRSAELDAHRITVETTGGDVILRGTVRSWAERQEAERSAWAAPGVRHVDNRITVSL